jgi:hypothetical protein
MITDNKPEQDSLPLSSPEGSGNTMKFAAVFVILAALIIGQFYTVHKVNATKTALEAQQAQTRQEISTQLQDQLTSRMSALERNNTEQLAAIRQELDGAAKRMGRTGGELKRARAMVAQLEQQQQQQAEQLKIEIALKADAQQVGALSQDVTATKTDLNTTKKSLDTMKSDLGMARSELGTLIARNHDEIEQLRKLGDRDYYEFTLDRNAPKQVANVTLTLKKANVKRLRFNMLVNVDDISVEKKDRTINEPVFFYVKNAKKPYELVVNSIQSHQVRGYLSTPKGATEVAARSEGTQ